MKTYHSHLTSSRISSAKQRHMKRHQATGATHAASGTFLRMRSRCCLEPIAFGTWAWLLISGAVLFSCPARAEEMAQESAPTEPQAETASDDGASVDAAATEEQPAEVEAQPAEPEVDPYAEAKERVGRAEGLYEEGNYDAALTEFQRAYDTMLGHPARSYVLYNVGRCQEKLYRYDSAIGSYRKYLQEAGPEAEDRATVAAKIELLEGLLGSVVVSVTSKKGVGPSDYQLWVDGRLIGENTTHFSIPGGNHEVEIRATGYEPALQEVQVAARQQKQLSFELSPLAKEYKGISPTYFWVTGGLALSAGITGGAFGIMTLTKHSQIQNMEPPLVDEDDQKQIQRTALMADIFLISAGVLATSATVLAFMTDWSHGSAPLEEQPGDVRQKTAQRRTVRVQEVGFTPLPSGGFVNLGGTF